MLRTTVLPMKNFHIKPAFWGLDRDLKEVLDGIENVWEGVGTSSFSDFKETDQAYFMSIEMPGVNKEGLELQIEGEHIQVIATRKRALIEGDDNVQKFSKTIPIPPGVKKDDIQARCEDGVLYLAIPKIEKAKPKKIQISQGGSDASWSKLLGQKNDLDNKA